MAGVAEPSPSATRDEFENWFGAPLRCLSEYHHGGLAVLMIAIPLLERYLREKSVKECELNDEFYKAFLGVFPITTRDERDAIPRAKDFWQCYRNGLLHQATFSQKPVKGRIRPQPWITGSRDATSSTVEYQEVENEFLVSPRNFALKVIDVISNDFETFLGSSSIHHPLPAEGQPKSFESSLASEIRPQATGVFPNGGPPPSSIE